MTSQSKPVSAPDERAGEAEDVSLASAWFAGRGWTPFEFQTRAWIAHLEGRSGLIHAPTGLGKSYAAFFGPVLEYLRERGDVSAGSLTRGRGKREEAEAVRVVWVTPMRALATDTVKTLARVVDDLSLPWTIEKRTGDTTSSQKSKQRTRLPTVLVTTPESLSVLLSYGDSAGLLRSVRTVVVDEWHELLGSKRGVQAELAIARVRAFAPQATTWGLSATLGNLDEAMRVLLGPASAGGVEPVCIAGTAQKEIRIETVLPEDATRFPWAGHLGLPQIGRVVEAIERVSASKCAPENGDGGGGGGVTLVFTNTRSQAEMWFRLIDSARPDWLGTIALHHGSLDRGVREEVERRLDVGELRAVVCTSSLDLGVDFSPVDQVIQIGSPRGVARLLQRAGRSGHRPGAVSSVLCVPTNALELVEFAAARKAVLASKIESREPLRRPMDVLVQHLVTIAAGGGFDEAEMLAEVRSTHAFSELTDQEWRWAMDFVTRGGPTLSAYPQYARVTTPAQAERRTRREEAEREQRRSRAEARRLGVYCDEWGADDTEEDSAEEPADEHSVVGGAGVVAASASDITTTGGRWVIATPTLARQHRLGIGTISSASSVQLAFGNGRSIGSVEESFIGRLSPGSAFVFGGRVLELVRVRGMTATVRTTTRKSGMVPRWGGGRMPISSQLALGVREELALANAGVHDSPEMQAVRPLLDLQRRWSRVPEPDELLIEHIETGDGHHAFVFAIDGRLVLEGLGALAAYRLTRVKPCTVTTSCTDYGFELLSDEPLDDLDEDAWRKLLGPDNLLDDLLACLDSMALARRRFRDIARIAGLIVPTYPGSARPNRHVQASSELFFDVFEQFDPQNLLLDQARKEVLEDQLEIRRLRGCIERLGGLRIMIERPETITPFALPLWAERLREASVTSESWSQRMTRLAEKLEARAAGVDRSAAAPSTIGGDLPAALPGGKALRESEQQRRRGARSSTGRSGRGRRPRI